MEIFERLDDILTKKAFWCDTQGDPKPSSIPGQDIAIPIFKPLTTIAGPGTFMIHLLAFSKGQTEDFLNTAWAGVLSVGLAKWQLQVSITPLTTTLTFRIGLDGVEIFTDYTIILSLRRVRDE